MVLYRSRLGQPSEVLARGATISTGEQTVRLKWEASAPKVVAAGYRYFLSVRVFLGGVFRGAKVTYTPAP